MDGPLTQPGEPVFAPPGGAQVTGEDVRRISQHPDPVIRNLQITLAYHDLSTAFVRLSGTGANWCAFATWASRQAGQSIRREDLSRALERLLGEEPEAQARADQMLAESEALAGAQPRSFGGAVEALWDAVNPASAFERTSAAVARGNLKVFEEIGAEFARFLALFARGWPTDEAFAGFFAALRPGDPPEGQRYLVAAFEHYRLALAADESSRKTQYLLLANLEIGFHEQTRLQPEILEAMNSPVADPRELRRRLVDELFPDRTSKSRYWLARLARRTGGLLAARDRFADELQRVGRRVVTDTMMTLSVPRGRLLRLGDPLPDPFPPSLAAPDLPDLLAFLRDAVSPGGTAGATDWGDLAQRMNFIGDLFRTYHLAPELFDSPFTAGQVAEIRNGRCPSEFGAP